MHGQLKLGRVLWDAVLAYVRRLPVFLATALIAAVAGAAIFVAVSWKILGFAADGAALDPTTFGITLNRDQWVLITAGGFAMGVVASLAMAASIHLACEPISVRRALSKVTAKSMQIFWLQCVIYAVAVRFSPIAVPLLWFSVAFGVGVAVREDLGPSDAMDRAWVLSAGSRIKILVLELLLVVPLFLFSLGIAYLFLIPGPWFNLNSIAPQVRQFFSVPITLLFLIPVQFTFVTLARAYEMLRQAEQETALHAEGASGVKA
jgi:hypothetical protein